MKAAHSLMILAAALGSQFALADSKEITLGSDAPAMSVKSWFKGSPVNSFDKNKTYVVEFWATWCGPCKESIPHLTELAKKNKDVTFVGVSIWEDDTDNNIKKFVDTMGAKMDYNVGYSGNKVGMAESWMQASGQNGIPTAFVVKGGKVQWIGHPMELEKPLDEIKSGKYNLAAAKVAFDKSLEAGKAERLAMSKLSQAKTLYKSGKKAEASAILDDASKASPQIAMEAKMLRLGWQSKEDVAGWRKQINEYANSKNPQEVMLVGVFAMQQTEVEGDKALGKEAIETALKATKESDFITLYYGSMFYKTTKDKDAYVKLLKKTLEVLPKSQYNNPQLKDSLEKQLTEASSSK